MTTNCIVPPKDTYKDRIYTTSVVGYPGLKHIKADENGHKDFSAIIEHAKKCSPRVAVRTSLNNIARHSNEYGEVWEIPLYLIWKLKAYL